MIDLSIIIVSFNTRDLVLNCLNSIFAILTGKIAFEVIVIDNNSSDGSQQALREFCHDKDYAHLVESRSNEGFAKANNRGIRLAKGRQVLLLNSDTYLIDDSLLQAMNFLDGHHDTFGCGCTLLNADHSTGISYGRFPEPLVVFLETATMRFSRLRAVVPRRVNSVYAIDYPCGAFFLIRRDMLERTGLLDEHFFMYCEETDLAKRAWGAGFRVMYFGPTRVVHLRGKSGLTDNDPADTAVRADDLRAVLYRSWRYYLEKHCSGAAAFFVKSLLRVHFKIHYFAFSLLNNAAARAHYRKEEEALLLGWHNKAGQDG